MADAVETPTNVPGDGEQPEAGTVFTQEELDRILTERLKRERAKYADYGELKAAAQKLQELEDAQKSELQRAQEAREEAERRAQATLDAANDRLMRAAFIAEAAKLGAAHPEDAYALADRSGVELTEGGDVQGVAEAVRALVDAGRLVMSGKPQAPRLDGGAGGGDRPAEKHAALTPQELTIANKMGMTPEEYAEFRRDNN